MFKKFNFIFRENMNKKLFYSHIITTINSLLKNSKNIDDSEYELKYLLITRLFDNDYWARLQTSCYNSNYAEFRDFFVIDPRSWFLTDNEFLYYSSQIAKSKIPYLMLFENPFGNEYISDFDVNEFEQKLEQRSLQLYENIKHASPSTKIISPLITINNKQNERYIDFLIRNRNIFNYWSIDATSLNTEQNISLLLTLINQCMTALKKPTLVLQWNISSCETKIFNRRSMTATEEDVPSYEHAKNILRSTFNRIEKTVGSECFWFYSGAIKDIYDPNKYPLKKYWDNISAQKNANEMWKLSDFAGLFTYLESIKSPILVELIDLFSNVK